MCCVFIFDLACPSPESAVATSLEPALDTDTLIHFLTMLCHVYTFSGMVGKKILNQELLNFPVWEHDGAWQSKPSPIYCSEVSGVRLGQYQTLNSVAQPLLIFLRAQSCPALHLQLFQQGIRCILWWKRQLGFLKVNCGYVILGKLNRFLANFLSIFCGQ